MTLARSPSNQPTAPAHQRRFELGQVQSAQAPGQSSLTRPGKATSSHDRATGPDAFASSRPYPVQRIMEFELSPRAKAMRARLRRWVPAPLEEAVSSILLAIDRSLHK